MGDPKQIDGNSESIDNATDQLHLTPLSQKIIKHFTPALPPNESLRHWQEWILQTVLVVLIGCDLIISIFPLIQTQKKGLWPLILFYMFLIAFCVGLIMARKLTYIKRVTGTLAACYSLGLSLILVFGISGGGPYFLFTFAILTALLLDFEATKFTLVLNAVTLILAVWLPQNVPIKFTPTHLIIFWLIFLGLNIAVAISASILVQRLHLAFIGEHETKITLNKRQQKIAASQRRLEKEIETCKHSEIAFRKRENQYRILAENVSDHIWILDLEAFLYIYTSPSITSILGYSPTEIIGRSIWDYIHPESVNMVKKWLAEQLDLKQKSTKDNKRMRAIEFMERRKDGTMVWVETQVSLIRDDKGHPTSILGVSRDISRRKATEAKLVEAYAALDERVWERTEDLTEKNKELEREIVKRKRAQEISERANKAKSDFLANMSHELRTPLNHIIGFTELVIDKHFGPINSTQEEYLNDVLSSSRHLLSVINDILDLSKIEAGKMVFNPTEVRINSVLATSFNMIREKAIKHKIQLTSETGQIPKKITADERKLKQIMYNLLSNAAKFTPDNGRIHVTAQSLCAQKNHLITSSGKKISLAPLKSKSGTKPREYLEIMVSDSGIGIKPEDLTTIFSPFEQVESDASRKYEGTGLGLPLSKRLVKLHGGWIWAESDGLKKGSRFYVIIPVDGPN
jgi:PAS domain S-box-containing protein